MEELGRMKEEKLAPEFDLRRRTKSFALRIIRLTSSLPKSMEAQVIGRQVMRSGTSIGANYCEAHRGRSKAEFVAKAGDCLREAEETAYWLDLLKESGLSTHTDLHGVQQECDELIAIFVTIIKRARANGQK